MGNIVAMFGIINGQILRISWKNQFAGVSFVTEWLICGIHYVGVVCYLKNAKIFVNALQD